MNSNRTDTTLWVATNVPDSCCVKMESECGWNYKNSQVAINEEVSSE